MFPDQTKRVRTNPQSPASNHSSQYLPDFGFRRPNKADLIWPKLSQTQDRNHYWCSYYSEIITFEAETLPFHICPWNIMLLFQPQTSVVIDEWTLNEMARSSDRIHRIKNLNCTWNSHFPLSCLCLMTSCPIWELLSKWSSQMMGPLCELLTMWLFSWNGVVESLAKVWFVYLFTIHNSLPVREERERNYAFYCTDVTILLDSTRRLWLDYSFSKFCAGDG